MNTTEFAEMKNQLEKCLDEEMHYLDEQPEKE